MSSAARHSRPRSSRPEFIATCLAVSREVEDRFETLLAEPGDECRLAAALFNDRPGGAADLAVVVPRSVSQRADLSRPGAQSLVHRMPDGDCPGRNGGCRARDDASIHLHSRLPSRTRSNHEPRSATNHLSPDRHHPPRATAGLCRRFLSTPRMHAITQLVGQTGDGPADWARGADPGRCAGAIPRKGTGAVMCCTFGDTTDVAWWRGTSCR